MPLNLAAAFDSKFIFIFGKDIRFQSLASAQGRGTLAASALILR
jgi:hypothetical protein